MSLNKHGLGRGITSLIGEYDNSTYEVEKLEEAGVRVLDIEINKIKPTPNQPRKNFDQDALLELSQSITEQGVLIPLLIEEIARESYIVIAGERRYRAAKIAGLKTLPCIIRDFTDIQRMEVALIENIQRENLNPVEEARAFNYLLVQQGIKQEDLAKRIGKSRSAIANSLRLLNLPAGMLEGLQKGEFSAGHARALLSVENPADREVLYLRILRDGLSVRQTEAQATGLNKGSRAINTLLPNDEGKAKEGKDEEVESVEEKFLSATGCKVEIKGKLTKGKIVIPFSTSEELERIYQLFSPGDSLFDYDDGEN